MPPAAYGYWPGGDQAPPHARLPIVTTVLALCAGITFFLPWATFSFSLSGTSTVPVYSLSVSLWTMFEDSDWPGHLWPDLVVLGFLLALASSFFDAVLRLDRRAAIAEALGFGAVAAGVVVALASRFSEWPFSYLGSFSLVSPGYGAWLCLIIAAAGAIAAVVRFASPNAFTPAAPPYAAAPYAPPFASPYPGAWAPPYPSTPYGSAPYAAPVPSIPPTPYGPALDAAPVPSMPPPPAGETAGQAPALDLSGAPGTLVILLAGQTTTRTVKPGELLLVGRDPNSGIVLEDPGVSPRHASIERRGPGWLVRSLDVFNPIRVLDDTGRAHPVEGELGLRSGQLLIGSAQVRLYPT
jgi:hypothetical protein